MKFKYSKGFKEQALLKVFSREERTLRSVANELNISLFTLRDWMKMSVHKTIDLAPKAKHPLDWSMEDRLIALNASHHLSGEALNPDNPLGI